MLCVFLVQETASDWVRDYETSPEEAVKELIQFFITCCGCRVVFTMDMFRGETCDMMSVINESVMDTAGEYPLIVHGSGGKKFRVSHVMC